MSELRAPRDPGGQPLLRYLRLLPHILTALAVLISAVAALVTALGT